MLISALMHPCAYCHAPLKRLHRTAWQKLLYQAVYRCGQCGEREPLPRRLAFVFWSRARCPQCGTGKLRVHARRDRAHKLFSHPLSRVQQLFGARLYHCVACRLQFYDLRAPVARLSTARRDA